MPQVFSREVNHPVRDPSTFWFLQGEKKDPKQRKSIQVKEEEANPPVGKEKALEETGSEDILRDASMKLWETTTLETKPSRKELVLTSVR